MEDVREFVGQNESEAVELAVRHFGVPREQLEIRVISAQLQISGLGGRVMVVAKPVEVPVELSPVGAFLVGVLERMQLSGEVRVAERDEAGVTQLLVSGPGVQDLTRRVSGTKAALIHLTQRAAEQRGASGSSVRIEVDDSRQARGPRAGRGRESGRPERSRERERGRGGRERSGPGEGRRRDSDEEDEKRLEQLARERAAEVLRSGEAAILPPLNSRERWFVHQALNEVEGIHTESDGEGRLKRIKIVRG
ncbi:MAG: hypothetical protein HRU00_02190 [Myxococcales bacterium]|nr:hypothetical protein [Myxococcales bacterium]